MEKSLSAAGYWLEPFWDRPREYLSRSSSLINSNARNRVSDESPFPTHFLHGAVVFFPVDHRPLGARTAKDLTLPLPTER